MGKRGPKPGTVHKAPGAGRNWPKGVSGNPGGFTKEHAALRRIVSESHGRRMQAILPDELWADFVKDLPGLPKGLTFAEAIAYGLAVEAVRGTTSAAAEITDRLEGKVKQVLDVRNVGAYDDETLDNRIAELLRAEKSGEEKPN